jgi:hypothetical protein
MFRIRPTLTPYMLDIQIKIWVRNKYFFEKAGAQLLLKVACVSAPT